MNALPFISIGLVILTLVTRNPPLAVFTLLANVVLAYLHLNYLGRQQLKMLSKRPPE